MSTDLVKQTAEKLGLPEEQVHIVISDLWAGVKHYFYYPHKVKYGIMFNKFFKFKLRRRKIQDYIDFIKDRQSPRSKFNCQYWQDVLDNLNKYGNSKRKEQP
jgi:hypothetical protein